MRRAEPAAPKKTILILANETGGPQFPTGIIRRFLLGTPSWLAVSSVIG